MIKFWIIMRYGQEKPLRGKLQFHHHMSLFDAQMQAANLSRQNPEAKFRIMEAVGQTKMGSNDTLLTRGKPVFFKAE